MRVGEHGRREEVRNLKSTEMPPYEAPEDRASLGKRRAPKRGQCSTLVLCRSPPLLFNICREEYREKECWGGEEKEGGRWKRG